MTNIKIRLSGKMRLGWYWRTVCSVAWYSPGEVMWCSNYCVTTFIDYITVNFPSPNVLAGDMFGAGIFHWYLMPLNRYQTLFHIFIFSLPHPKIFNLTELNRRHSTCPVYLNFLNLNTVISFLVEFQLWIHLSLLSP
jgi:hypothetical protein